MNGLSLAYLGDAYYELAVRRYLLSQGITKIDQLHKQKVKFSSNASQMKAINYFLKENILTEDEMDAFKKGRNGAHFGRKNIDIVTYQQATGFESLIGYLSIHNEERCKELIAKAIDYIRLGE
ncbi:Mini-ribonuclease 3 [Acholeplasma hippikon]|uniref:Mini-ribonuclease 3 n=1 Tax=Acholeplasma hippikon TaxID=264636 RepID=A0A449BKR6_9MOLU|nr:ribonuclease III domain-containing protein [Acholeplasma hippikon]VEU82927.1 Mini-ribonuclease 3 [Acholeplasma hippikon]